MTSTTLVNVSEDAEVRLVAMLAETATNPDFQATCQASIEEGKAGDLIKTILADTGALLVFTQQTTEDAMAAFALLVALADRAGRVQDLIAMVSKLDAADAERRIALLSVLYNMRTRPSEKMMLLQHMIELAPLSLLEPEQTLGRLLNDDEATKQPRVVSLLDQWKVSKNDRQKLYQTVTRVLPNTDIRKQRFLLILIAYSSNDTAASKEAAIGAIRDPVSCFAQQRNMMSLPAIQALEKTDAKLFGLLKVFQEGKLSDYQAFLDSNGGEGVLKQWELDASACQNNMRILSLCSLASEHDEIPYSAIAETLKLPSDAEVESWVIAAVSSGLLQAKMDQLQKRVMVERSVVRKFDMAQWKALQSRLALWKTNVGGILDALKESQVGSASVKPH